MFCRASVLAKGLKRDGEVAAYLEIGPVILGDVWAVALGQHHDLLLYILDLILRLLEIDDLDGDNLLGPIVDAFEHLSETTLPNPFLFREYQLGVHLLGTETENYLPSDENSKKVTTTRLGEEGEEGEGE